MSGSSVASSGLRRLETRRVAITGAAAISAAGVGVDKLWDGVVRGRGLASRVPIDSWPGDEPLIGCQIPDFSPRDWMPVAVAKRASRSQQLVIAASRQLTADRLLSNLDLDRTGVSIGTCFGGIELAERQLVRMRRGGWRRIDPFVAAGCMPNTIPGFVALEHGFKGPNSCPSTACAAGAHAIAEACNQIVLGRADVMVAGGVDSPFSELAYASFMRVGVLSGLTDDPSRAARPFDRYRDGFVLGEGVGLLLLEELEHARARGVPILGEVVGWATNADAFNMMTPARYGSGARQCMSLALDDADLAPHDVGHVNAHGTGTVANDASEAQAISSLFGPIPVTATKAVLGHCMGAAGAIEAIVTLSATARSIVPPTASTVEVPSDFEIDLVAGTSRTVSVPHAVSNSFALGGQNVSLVIYGNRPDGGAVG